MSVIAIAFALLVLSGLGTTLLAGAAAIMLTSELSDTTVSIYDQSMPDYSPPTMNASLYTPSFSDLKPVLARVDMNRVDMNRVDMGSVSGSLSAETLAELMATSVKKAEGLGRVIRRRSVFIEEPRRLSLRC